MATTQTKQPQRAVEAADRSVVPSAIATRVNFANAVAINFSMSADALEEYIPQGLVLDYYKGETYVSLVCMEVKGLTFLGLPMVPRFCELSLRCFVSERADSSRRGVFILKSYASSKFGSWVFGNLIPNSHQVLPIKANNQFGANRAPDLDYQWKVEGHENRMRIRARDRIARIDPSSKLGFILSHSTRYQSIQGQVTVYDVGRPEWDLWDAAQANFTCDVRRLFGTKFVKPLAARPVSVFLSPGSKVTLHKPSPLASR